MPEPTIPCTKCNYVNEVQRIYCHNCGEKLDRSKVIEQQEQAARQTAAQQPKKAQSLKPRIKTQETSNRWLKPLLRTICYAALTAALILAALPPVATPPASPTLPSRPEAARSVVESVLMASAGSSATISPQAVNDYLRVYGKVAKLSEGWVETKRAFAILDNDTIQINLENSVKGAPFYVGAAFRVVTENHRIAVTPLHINIGRLKLPPIAMPLISRFITPLLQGLETEHQLVNKLGGLVITKEGITVSSPPRQP